MRPSTRWLCGVVVSLCCYAHVLAIAPNPDPNQEYDPEYRTVTREDMEAHRETYRPMTDEESDLWREIHDDPARPGPRVIEEPLHDPHYHAFKEWRRQHDQNAEAHRAFVGKLDPQHLHDIIREEVHAKRPPRNPAHKEAMRARAHEDL